MSVNGEYLRVTPAELARAVKDPEWAFEYVMEVMETDGINDVAPSDARQLTTHKAFDAIAFLLERASFPVDIVHGEQTFTSEDWGYGPAKYLDADQVELAAGALAGLSFEDLIREVGPEQMTAAQIYPLLWDEADALEWVRGWFGRWPRSSAPLPKQARPCWSGSTAACSSAPWTTSPCVSWARRW